jgi:hypothetical protein
MSEEASRCLRSDRRAFRLPSRRHDGVGSTPATAEFASVKDNEEASLMLELTAAADEMAASLRKLTRVLRRIELLNRLQQLEVLETRRSALGDATSEGEMAAAAIARARSGG